ncbi:hypothetical protein [Castellaniella sp.]|uniref:hypothetical protein n=1 Tax=Castellaniella sp. TaxID=1955812 RepID=UPI003560D3C3
MVVEQLEPILDRLIEVFDLRVCHGKGDLSRYGVPDQAPPSYQAAFFAHHGIRGALLPVGDTFLEVIAPLRPDVSAARYLQRRGEGGYMVITEVDDLQRWRDRAAAQAVRIAGAVDYPTYQELQLDPRDVGASILSFSMQRVGRPFDGGWFPAGEAWQERAAPGWQGIVCARLSSTDPEGLAGRWSNVLDRPLMADRGVPRIDLDEGTIEFQRINGPARLSGIDLAGASFGPSLARACEAERTADGQGIRIAGLEFREGST